MDEYRCCAYMLDCYKAGATCLPVIFLVDSDANIDLKAGAFK
jgi:hypothetical protein